MVRIKVDNRLRWLLEMNCHASHRSMFVVVGPAGPSQIPLIYHLMTKVDVRPRRRILWCFKRYAATSSAAWSDPDSSDGVPSAKKKLKLMEKQRRKKSSSSGSQASVVQDEAMNLFVKGNDIRYCYYKDTNKILGQTFGMAILQDFEAITPNVLARTVETVEGGGVILLLLQSIDSLNQLYTMTMDVHARYRTAAFGDDTATVPRFNERFLLSLANNPTCLVLDDRLNILPISNASRMRITEEAVSKAVEAKRARQIDGTNRLKELQDKFVDTQPTSALLNLCKTADQAAAVLEFIDALVEEGLNRTVAMTAARGRGKSAALGLAVAAAVGFGYSNILVTSPTPENLTTLFEFVTKGLDVMKYEEHVDYDIVQSTNPDFNKAVIRINIHDSSQNISAQDRDAKRLAKSGQLRQIVQYIFPSDSGMVSLLANAELVVVDEAAAIPLPLVEQLIGPHLVFLSSTVNGYEGTGRSLSLKLIDELRRSSNVAGPAGASESVSRRQLRELTLSEAIRYGSDDGVESWLSRLLCLDLDKKSEEAQLYTMTSCPMPAECELYLINRDTLFSAHTMAEAFLRKCVALFVASHYKNTPNDLQMMSDAPAHRLFCLLGPTAQDEIPEVLCVIQVCLEGRIKSSVVDASAGRGQRSAGDLIPWTVSQQFQDNNFAGKSGLRIIRIATHPEYQRMGYGTRAVQLLIRYYGAEMSVFQEVQDDEDRPCNAAELITDGTPTVRASLPPLLSKVDKMRPESIDYIGVSFGLTQSLLRFWLRVGNFYPVYIRQTANDLTGEHTVILINGLRRVSDVDLPWLVDYNSDFIRRLVRLLGCELLGKKMRTVLALTLLSARAGSSQRAEGMDNVQLSCATANISQLDLRRLSAYANNLIDHHVITDVISRCAEYYFSRIKPVKLSLTQEAILLAIGLQGLTIERTADQELRLPLNQILALLSRMMRKFVSHFSAEHDVSPTKGRLASVADELTPKRLPIGYCESNGNANSKSDKLSPTAWPMTRSLTVANDSIVQGKVVVDEEMKSLNLSSTLANGQDDEQSNITTGNAIIDSALDEADHKPVVEPDSHKKGNKLTKKLSKKLLNRQTSQDSSNGLDQGSKKHSLKLPNLICIHPNKSDKRPGKENVQADRKGRNNVLKKKKKK